MGLDEFALQFTSFDYSLVSCFNISTSSNLLTVHQIIISFRFSKAVYLMGKSSNRSYLLYEPPISSTVLRDLLSYRVVAPRFLKR